MRITFPRCSWRSLLLMPLVAYSIAACSSLDRPSRFPQVKAPAEAFNDSSERLRNELREYLKEEDRWIPRGRDTSLWQSAEMLWASSRNLSTGLTNTRLTPQELGELIRTANTRLNDLDYWMANSKIDASLQRSLGQVHSSLSSVQRSAKNSTPASPKQSAVTGKSRKSTFFAPESEPFSPNDLNGAVQIGKAYLVQKYGIKRESFGNMRARELSDRHEVILETNTTRYILLVDTRKGTVVSEKSAPKPAHHLTASR